MPRSTHGVLGQPGGNQNGQRTQFASVNVSPTMQWAVPNSALNGPPASQPARAYADLDGSITGAPHTFVGNGTTAASDRVKAAPRDEEEEEEDETKGNNLLRPTA